MAKADESDKIVGMMEKSQLLDHAATIGKPAKKPSSRGVIFLMGVNIFLALGVALAGYYLLESPGIALAGAVLATLGALIMLFYHLWGGKQ
jgi:hypothetical protein